MDSDTKDDAGGQFVVLDEKKLGLEGREMLGGIKALTRWMVQFGSMRDRSSDVQERVFLSEVIAALGADVEDGKVALAQFALARGAGKIHDAKTEAEGGGKPN